MSKPTIVLLRQKGSKESRPFDPDHAERLLNYPNTQWEEVAEKAAAKAAPAASAKPEANPAT